MSTDYYFNVETYPYNVVPISCTTGSTTSGQSVNYPVAYIAVYNSNNLASAIDYKYYVAQAHNPILIASSAWTAGDRYTIGVQYQWIGSPGNQYTLKAYSKLQGVNLLNSAGQPAMLHMDGQQPSGYTNS